MLVLLAPAGGAGPCRAAQDTPPAGRGPFEERVQFPLHLLFLTFPARGGALLAAGKTEVSLAQTYANVFVGSDLLLLDYDDATDGRQRLTRAYLAAAQASRPDADLYLVDLEQGRTELHWRRGFGRRWEAGLEIPFLTRRGGSFDSVIEAYHSRVLGFEGEVREEFERDATQVAITLDGAVYFTDRSPGRYRLGDASVFLRGALRDSARLDLALALGCKLPTGDPDALAGSGGADVGLALEGTLRGGRQRMHFAGGWIRSGDWDLFPGLDPTDVASAMIAYEFVGNGRLSWVAQLQSQTSALRGSAGNDLALPSTEILLGARWGSPESLSFEAAVIENLFNQDNGVDIGLRVGVGARFGSR